MPETTPPSDAGQAADGPRRGSLVRWEGGSIPVAELVQAAPEELDHHLVLWVESGSERVVGVRFARSEESEGAVESLLEESMTRPATGSPSRPAEVLVTDAELAETLAARGAELGVGIRLVAECQSWSAVVTEFGAFLAAHWPGRSYLDGASVTPADVERFFHAAAAFYRRAPWDVLEERPVELRLADREEPLYAIALGRDRMVHGLTVYLSEACFRHRPRRDAHPMRARGTVAVTFDREDAVPPPMLEERRAHRWPLAGPAAFPLPYRQLADGTMCEPDAAELGLLAMSLHALAELAVRPRKPGPDGAPSVEAVQVPGPSGDAIARLTFPAPLAADGLDA
jgi:hypothetical protein